MVIFRSGFDRLTGCKIYYRISFIRCLNRDTSCLCCVPGTLLKQLRTFTLRERIGYRERERHTNMYSLNYVACVVRGICTGFVGTPTRINHVTQPGTVR